MQDIVEHASNFDFLADREPEIADLAEEAEVLASISPNTCMMQVRLVGELLAKSAATQLGHDGAEEKTFFEVLKNLEEEAEFGDEIEQIFHNIRQTANDVAHGEAYVDGKGIAKHYLQQAREVAVWYQRSFVDPDFSPCAFEAPPDYDERYREIRQEHGELQRKIERTQEIVEEMQTKARRESERRAEIEELADQLREERDVYESLAREYEQKLARLRTQLESQSEEEREEERHTHLQQMRRASKRVELSEEETRALIDAQLRQHGWRADSDALRWGDGARPEPGVDQAIAEVPTGSGRADYVLFSGTTPLAAVEAKAWNRDVAGEIEQAKRYARDYEFAPEEEPPGGTWTIDGEAYRIPFVFAANGRDYLHQIERKSGVWFQDLRRPVHDKRALAGWYRPDGLRTLLERDEEGAFATLEAEPLDYLGLRDYQEEAVREVERALRRGQRRALLAMATGTGKTRTAIGLAYRFVKSGLFDRILFLVDRRTLGRQAHEAFETVPLEGGRPFAEIYSTRDLETSGVGPDTRLSIATIQSMVRRVVDPDHPSEQPPIEQFDCLIVDEAHRGYNLDREMSDVEMEFRNHEDFISKYRRVLDHFDAVRVALTATPAKKTTEIFGPPVYAYRYQQAVLDGHLVDQEPPVEIQTRLREYGISYEEGEELTLLDTETGEIDYAQAPDELQFDVSDFNRAIQIPAFNEAICEALAERIDLEAPGKTLIFCVDQNHAEEVERALHDAYRRAGEAPTDGAIKIVTGYTDDVDHWFRRFKNEKKPTIAITVDYLTTGVDIPRITNLVFLRRVKSRILYEQMKGRATRLCPEINKDAYRIFDCVDLYDGLEQVTDMQPVVQQPNLDVVDHYEELTTCERGDQLSVAQRDFVGKLQRKIKRLSDAGEQQFEQMTGMEPEDFVETIRDRPPEEAAEWLEGERNLVERIAELDEESREIVYEPDADDTVIEVEPVEADEAPDDDFLEEFEGWVAAHLDQWEVLQMVAQRPRELTRESLIELERTLSREGYDSEALQEAWSQRADEDVAASIVGFVRRAALGEPLVPYEERVQFAVDRLKEEHDWTGRQRKWLDRIRKMLIKNQQVPDPENLNQPPFEREGGFERLDQQHFNGELESILDRINDAMWEYEAGA